jgi:hypothetical protein
MLARTICLLSASGVYGEGKRHMLLVDFVNKVNHQLFHSNKILFLPAPGIVLGTITAPYRYRENMTEVLKAVRAFPIENIC